MQNMKKILTAAAVAGFALCASPAQAIILYDQNVTPDVIFGSGNDNGAWTVETANNIEIGLRAKTRYLGTYNSNGDGTYNQASGISSGSAGKWNYEFAINLNADVSGSRLFNDVIIGLSVDTDPSAATSFTTFTFDPLAAWNDNVYGTNATANGAGDKSSVTNANRGVSSGLYVAQNSQNIGWLGLDVLYPATYDFKLTVTDLQQNLLASTNMSVLVDGGATTVPEPSVLALLGIGLAGLAAARRRKQMA